MEEVIVHHLLPLVQKRLSRCHNRGTKRPQIVGAEWWTHTREVGVNLGHQLHFDTDEAMLAQTTIPLHPIVSSVLYLTGEGDAGSTLVLDQTVDAKRLAGGAWKCKPEDNSFMIFPGDLLHGVLPCRGSSKEGQVLNTNGNQNGHHPKHRLTLMVGFWTRNVPEEINGYASVPYSPCGPLPEAGWVNELHEGYDTPEGLVPAEENGATEVQPTSPEPLPFVSPAWEYLPHGHDNLFDDEQKLSIPKELDHRFFVQEAPECFRKSLTEKYAFGKEEEEEKFL